MGLLDFLKKKKTDETKTLSREENNGATPNNVSAPATKSSSPAAPSPMSPEEMAEKVMILVPYIKQYRSQGMLDEEISAFLQDHSWPAEIIQRALLSA